MRNMKKFTSISISKQLEKANEKQLLYVFKRAAEREKGKRYYKIHSVLAVDLLEMM